MEPRPQGAELFGRRSAAGIEVYGRDVEIYVVPPQADAYGQFWLSVVVDGKERWGAYFTNRSEDA